MRTGRISTLFAMLLAPGLARAISLSPAPPPSSPPAASTPFPVDGKGGPITPAPVGGKCGCGEGCSTGCSGSSCTGLPACWARGEFDPCTEHVWVDGEYLLWWFKNGHLPPLVGSVPASVVVVNQGNLPANSVVPVFGDENFNLDAFSGGRVSGGVWLDHCQKVGIDGNFFITERRIGHFAGQSSGDPVIGPLFGNPINGLLTIIVPPTDTRTGNLVPAFMTANGSVSERLLGAELNARTRLVSFGNCPLDFFAGFRFASLNGDLDKNTSLSFVDPTAAMPGPRTLAYMDHFTTKNRFYGGQVGSSIDLRDGPWSLTLIGKIALGGIERVTEIQGYSTDTNPPRGFPGGTLPGGILAQPSNFGRHEHNRFSWIPELTANFGYQLTCHVRGFVGYNLLFIDHVVRPGDAVDFGVNPSNIRGLTPTSPVPVRPVPVFNDSLFWAQGINFGLEVRF